MTIISPSLLSCDFLNIESELKYFKNANDIWFHLDIMDGHFVPNMTFGHPIVKLISQKTNIPLDAHFMVTNPKFYIDTFKDYGIHNFTFHIEADENPIELIREAKKYYPSVGISLKPKTEVSQLSLELLEALDLVLIMSVEPGFGGQKFIENSYQKVADLKSIQKEKGFKFSIQIDGGVNGENAKKLIETGVDNLVAGSYVFKDGPSTYLDKINSLR